MTLSRIQKLESLGFEWDRRVTYWEDRLSELTDYRKLHGHCNASQRYIENIKLGDWVATQRKMYRLHLKGKTSSMTLTRIQKLESLGFEWDSRVTYWEDRLSELADCRKIHGHCNVPKGHSENTKLSVWVGTQRHQYRLHLKGKTSSMTLSRIQKLEGLGFEWDSRVTYWEDRLSELTDYRKLHGNCNVPKCHSENTKLAYWVATQRRNYRLHRQGKKSPLTLSRIQKLESLGFEPTTTAPPGKTAY
jgi:hypothetical protein